MSKIRPHYQIALCGALVAVALTACGEHPAAGAGAGAPKAPIVGVITLATHPLGLTTELAGRTSPHLMADVRPQVNGIIKSRLFVEGSDVKAGQVLYQIDDARYQADNNSAKAALAKAQANLTSAKLKAQRYGELVGINAVSKQSNDDAQAALLQAQADVASAQAALQTTQINLAYSRVTAPISGHIGPSSVTPGALVTANQSAALASIQQLDPIYVDVTQTTSELLRLQRALASGQLKRASAKQARVKLVLEDGSAYPLEGKLQFSDVSVDPGTGSVTLRAVFPNPQHVLLPGMFVRAVLEEGVDEHALLVPQLAVSRNSKGQPTAFVLGSDGKVQMRVLSIDRAIGDQWLVDTGLQAGDRLIVEGLQKIRPGASAQAQAWQPASAASAASAAQ